MPQRQHFLNQTFSHPTSYYTKQILLTITLKYNYNIVAVLSKKYSVHTLLENTDRIQLRIAAKELFGINPNHFHLSCEKHTNP